MGIMCVCPLIRRVYITYLMIQHIYFKEKLLLQHI